MRSSTISGFYFYCRYFLTSNHIQLFNIRQQISSTDLSYLHTFFDYARQAQNGTKLGVKAPFQVTNCSSSKFLILICQSLVYLVRDWPNPEELMYGFDGGLKYVEETLNCDKVRLLTSLLVCPNTFFSFLLCSSRLLGNFAIQTIFSAMDYLELFVGSFFRIQAPLQREMYSSLKNLKVI